MVSFPDCSNLKESGVGWAEKIQKQWEVKRLKDTFSFGKGLHITKADLTDAGIPVISYGQIHSKQNTGTHLKEELLRHIPSSYLETNPSSVLNKGDIVLADTSEDLDGLGNAVLNDMDDLVFAGYHTIILRPHDAGISKYVAYLLSTDNWRAQLRARAGGIKVFSATQRMLRGCTIILPPAQERDRITEHLDDQCAKIDGIISEVKASVENYRCWETSIFYEAVTRGLNPDVEAKESGIEWIGRTPRHWKTRRVKTLLSEMDKRSTDGKEEPLSMSQVLGLVPSSQITVANPALSYVGGKIVEPGNLVLNRLKAHLGVFATSKYKGVVSPDYAVFQAKEGTCPEFLELLFKTPRCITEFKKHITGVATGLSRLYTKDLFDIKVAIPGLEEQEAIVRTVQDKSEKIRSIISEKEGLIADLEAYKKALIYEVVTGKRRVV